MSRLRRFYPQRCARRELRELVAAVNVVDQPADGEIGGRCLLETQDLNFPAGELNDNPNSIDRAETSILRTSEIGQELTQLTTEQETSKPGLKDTQHGMWSDSYSDDNSFEDADLKLGENINDTAKLSDPVYAPYSNGNGPIDSRYEDSDEQRQIVLHSSQHHEEDRNQGHSSEQNNQNALWVCVDLDGTILSPPEEYQDKEGFPLFGEILSGNGRIGPGEALQELIDGGARVSIYTARQYFATDGSDKENLIEGIQNKLSAIGVPFTDIYIGNKPPAHFFVDDRTIPPFDGDWELVLDTVRPQMNKQADDKVRNTVDFQGLPIDIEWPAGSIRSYQGQDSYVTHMKADYGYIRGAEGADGDCLDCYVLDRNSTSPKVFIIEQVRQDGSYDEDKLVLGATSEGEAVDCYLQHMPAFMLGDIREVSVEKLKHALFKKPEDRRGKPGLVPKEEKVELAKKAFNLDKAIHNLRERRTDLYLPDQDKHLTDKEWLAKRDAGLITVQQARARFHKQVAWVRKVAAYSDLAVKALEDVGETALLICKYVDLKGTHQQMVDGLVRAMLNHPELLESLVAKFGPVDERRPLEKGVEEQLVAWPHLGPTGTQPIVRAFLDKKATIWGEDDPNHNEFTDGLEDRDNRDIARPHDLEASVITMSELAKHTS